MFVVTERTKRVTLKGEENEKKDEEDWPLKDVIFVEDVKNFPVGELILLLLGILLLPEYFIKEMNFFRACFES